MNTLSFPISLITLAAVTFQASASAAARPDSASVMSRIARQSALDDGLTTTAWKNPAILQFKRNYSFSEVALSYSHDKQSQPVNAMRGDGSSTWAFDADSQMKYKTSTIWGHALYRNSRTFHVK